MSACCFPDLLWVGSGSDGERLGIIGAGCAVYHGTNSFKALNGTHCADSGNHELASSFHSLLLTGGRDASCSLSVPIGSMHLVELSAAVPCVIMITC